MLEYDARVWPCWGEVNSRTLEGLLKHIGGIVINESIYSSSVCSSDTTLKGLKWLTLIKGPGAKTISLSL